MLQISTIILVAASLAIYLVGRAFYDVFLHPLAKFPGPFCARFTRLWLFFEEMKGDGAHTLMELHKKHGDFVRIAPNELSFNNQEAFLTIYKQGTKFPKHEPFYSSFSGISHNVFTMADSKAHSQDKRLMSHAFSKTNLLGSEDLIYAKVQKLMDLITERVRRNEAIPLYSAFRALTFDTITSFCYGDTPGLLETGNFEAEFFDAVDGSLNAMVVFQQFPFLRSLLSKLGQYMKFLVPIAMRNLENTSLQRLRALEKDAYDQKAGQCLFQSMIALADKNNYPVTESQLVSESGVMLFAGTDTTAGTLAVGLFHILQRPDVYTQLQDELRKAMPDRNSRLPYSELEKLPLLDACLKEGLRLTVPLRGRLPRVVPEDGWEFQGIHFKPGTVLGTSPYYQCYDEKAFPMPYSYRPERWMDGNAMNLEPYFHPFSRGTRQCIGQTLSIIEQRVALAEFVRCFSPSGIAPKNRWEFDEYAALLMKNNLDIHLKLA